MHEHSLEKNKSHFMWILLGGINQFPSGEYKQPSTSAKRVNASYHKSHEDDRGIKICLIDGGSEWNDHCGGKVVGVSELTIKIIII